MSVKLQLTGACKDCEYINLDLGYYRVYDGKRYSIKCIHEPTCYHMQREHEESMKAIDKALSELCGE